MDHARVLVTGAGRGIGRAIALRFARGGARTVVTARTVSELEATAAAIGSAGGEAVVAPMDVSAPASVANAMRSALAALDGTLDVLVNNAGIFTVRPFEETDPELWHRMIAVNLDGPYHVTREALPALRRSGRAHVFNIASIAARQGFAGSSAYCATKYGLRGFGDALRLELADEGIRVSTVYPGATDTTIFDDVPGEWDRASMNAPDDVAAVVWRAWSAPASEDVDDLLVPPPATLGG
jgi:NAD(P)-dependent dehydrogenase (short-subunit alcohol dehydrogenase family)